MTFDSECEEALYRLGESLPEDLAIIVYKKHLVNYIRRAQNWMNSTAIYSLFGPDYRPSESEEAFRVISTRFDLLDYIEGYQKTDEDDQNRWKSPANESIKEYFIYSMSDEEVLKKRREMGEQYKRPSEDGLMGAGSAAFYVIDYESILPVTITDRSGFMYYCEDKDGDQYIVPCHHLFPTEDEAKKQINERDTHRDAAIEVYHLLEQSDNEILNKKRRLALDWLYYNQEPPKMLAKELKEALLCASCKFIDSANTVGRS